MSDRLGQHFFMAPLPHFCVEPRGAAFVLRADHATGATRPGIHQDYVESGAQIRAHSLSALTRLHIVGEDTFSELC
jgi:hypothetical protein